ncbi:MAG: hypothetical protein Q9178_006624 [Gyalolechia marmorata]
MSEFRSNQDYRLSWGSNAPEVDNTRLAPECRPDSACPEVDPGSGVQVFYEDLPPEAVATRSVEPKEENLNTKNAQNIRPTRKVIKSIIAVAVAVVAALGIGLGVGLHRRQVVPPPQELNISSPPTPTPTLLPHALMQNTPISAVTLNNTNRHLYFKEQTGAVRRAIYVAQADRWVVDVDARPLSNAKNDAPIAVVPTPLNADKDVALFYVNSANQLDCADWRGRKGDPLDGCDWIPRWPVNVAPESIPISVAALRSNESDRALLLTYQNTTQKPVLLLGYYKFRSTDKFLEWTWQDETEKLATASQELPITACRVPSAVDSIPGLVTPFFLYCVRGKDSWTLLGIEYVSPGNLSIQDREYLHQVLAEDQCFDVV